MVIHGSYMLEFSVCKDIEKVWKSSEIHASQKGRVAVEKVAAHLHLTPIVKA